MTTITVMGATGRTGGTVARELLKRGLRVRALGRDLQRLAPLAALGAEAVLAASDDAAALARAFDGADAAYLLMPHDPTRPGYLELQRVQGEAICRAARDAGLPRAVVLSSFGLEARDPDSVLAPLYDQEQRLRALPSLHLHLLQPVSYMENLLGALPSIRATGVYADTLAPDQPMDLVATRDVAAAALQALLGAVVPAEGSAREDADRAAPAQPAEARVRAIPLPGPAGLTPRRIAATIGAAIGRPELSYLQITEAEMQQALDEAGLAPDFAALALGLSRAIAEGRVGVRERLTAPPEQPVTGFEAFCREGLAPAWQRRH